MHKTFEDDVQTVSVSCAQCGAPIELASSALSLFESDENILCMDCLLRDGDVAVAPPLSIEQRIALIDDVVEDFGTRLRHILVRSVRPDLTWNSDYSADEWSDAADSAVAAHAPGIWYGGREAAKQRRRSALS